MNTQDRIALTVIERRRGKLGHAFYPEAGYDLQATNSHDIIGISTLKHVSVTVMYSVPKLGYKTSLISGITYTALDEDLTLASVTLNSRRMY